MYIYKEMTNTTTYRKDFTDEERIAYNKYMVSRMQIFRKTEHGREIVNANNRKAYQKKRAKILEERLSQPLKKVEPNTECETAFAESAPPIE
jgi:hypothetical protein